MFEEGDFGEEFFRRVGIVCLLYGWNYRDLVVSGLFKVKLCCKV